jgi:hypothetical protein
MGGRVMVPRRNRDLTAVIPEREYNFPLWHEHCDWGKHTFSARVISKGYAL